MTESDKLTMDRSKKRFPRAEKKVAAKNMVVSKRDRILNSKMPESQKLEYLKQLGLSGEKPEEKGKVSFRVYARLRSIGDNFHGAMMAFPSAKGRKLETPEQWDKIFKKF